MFCDDRYECKTMQEVVRELFRTQKFKTKYPWRIKYKSKIKALGSSEVKQGDFDLNLNVIKNLVYAGTKNKKTNHFFDLSYVDQIIAACTITHNYKLTTVDDNLSDFVEQEFSSITISPLGIINEWMEKGLIKWNDKFQELIEDWEKCNEHPQPRNEVKKFETLSGYKYAGPKEKYNAR